MVDIGGGRGDGGCGNSSAVVVMTVIMAVLVEVVALVVVLAMFVVFYLAG